MSGCSGRGIAPAKVVLWIARLLSVLWILFIAAEVIGEGGGFWPRGVAAATSQSPSLWSVDGLTSPRHTRFAPPTPKTESRCWSLSM